MAGINKVIILGRLGGDPDTRSFPDGGMIANVSIATSESWTDKNTGQKQERTEWHRVIFRDRGNYRLAQIASQYLRKGSQVYIEGKLQTRKYTDGQGVEKYVTEIIADNMQMLDSKQSDQQSGQYQPQPQMQHQGYAPQQGYTQPQGYAQQQSQPFPPSDFSDDIPF